MPISKSAKKSLRASLRKRANNLKWESALERGLKKPKDFSQLQKVIDKAAKKGVIQKNKAARLKSRLAKRLEAKSKVKVQKTKV